jgi:hypothetical protein
MRDTFVSHFCRNADASWTCTSAATVETPKGRIQVTQGSRFYPGTSFMGFDLARWLEQELGERAQRCA